MSLMLSRRAVVRSPLRFSLAATDYLKRLDAEGARIRMFDKANAKLIDALVELGGAYWDSAGTITTLCAKGFDGLTVPLRDGMNVGTPVAFDASDLNVKTGLKGDGSSKYIDSNRNNNADGQNNIAMGVWIATPPTTASATAYIGSRHPSLATPMSQLLQLNSTSKIARLNSGATGTFDSTADSGYFGASRSSGSELVARAQATNTTISAASSAPYDNTPWVFARNHFGSPAYSNTRLSLYHIGPALTLETLDGILTTFMSEVDAV